MTPADYLRAGWALVPIPKLAKGPKSAPGTRNWNRREKCVTGPEGLPRLTGNLGLAHAYSGTCALDFDDLERATAWLAEQGIDAAALFADPLAIRIDSGRPNRAKLLYRLATPLPTVKCAAYQDAEGKPRKALELRCATRDGYTVQDVLPPSLHPITGKPYAWRYDELVADPLHPPELPAPVLALWQRLAANGQAPEHPAPETPAPAAAEIRALLDKHDPDAPYDDWIRVGMAIHHALGADGFALWDEWSAQSSKYRGRGDLVGHWRSFGRATHPVTLASLRTQQPADPEEFTEVPAEAPRAGRFAPIPAGQMLAWPNPGWLVKHVIPRAGLVVVYGASGSGKTFAVLDLAMAIATGSDWREHRTTKGRVVYVVAEGQGGFKHRIDALQRQGVPIDALEVVTVVPNLLQAQDVRELIADIGPAAMIVLDTFAQVTPGANENASEDMGRALGHCRILHRETGATIVLVHHAGKDETKGARGWSGLKAAADAELEVSRFEETRLLRVTKMKDGTDGAVYPFRLTEVPLGEDDDGDPITSAIVEHTTGTGFAPARKRRTPGQLGQLVLDVITDLSGPEAGAFVAVEAVLDEAAHRLPHDPNAGKDQRRVRSRRAIERLAGDGWLLVENNQLAIFGELPEGGSCEIQRAAGDAWVTRHPASPSRHPVKGDVCGDVGGETPL